MNLTMMAFGIKDQINSKKRIIKDKMRFIYKVNIRNRDLLRKEKAKDEI